jgi:hypothetical protein
MALDKAGLKANIKNLIDSLKTYDGESPGQSQDDAVEKFANDLANAIDTFVKTATVSTSVTVTSVSGVTTGPGVSGPGAGNGSGSLS